MLYRNIVVVIRLVRKIAKKKNTIKLRHVCPAWNNLALTGGILMKFYFSVFFEKTAEKIKVFIKIGQEYRVLYMKTIDYITLSSS